MAAQPTILPATPVDDERKHTTQPIVTGTSVLAIKYVDGVMLSADTLGSYGSLTRFTDLRRLRKCGDNTIVGASGEYSDFQYIMELLDQLRRDERSHEDGSVMTPNEIHSYLTRVLYNRRNKGDPLWNELVIAGVDHDGKSFLGTVDHIGTGFKDNFIATGFGHHFAMPILREEWREDLTEAEARTLLEKCMRVCYYRDCRTINKIQLAKVSGGGNQITPPYSLDTKWDYESFIKTKAGADTGGSW